MDNKKNANSVALSPQAKYTDCAAVACRQRMVPNLRVEGYRAVSATCPHDF
jgi:hypothetical protein